MSSLTTEETAALRRFWVRVDSWPADPLRPPETDEEPWMPELVDPDAGVDLLDGAVVATGSWLAITTLTAAALAVVLALLALRRYRP